jgi:hypothetical protein
MLLNLDTEARSVEIEPRLPPGARVYDEWRLALHQTEGRREDLGAMGDGRALTVLLPPRTPVSIEAMRTPDATELSTV